MLNLIRSRLVFTFLLALGVAPTLNAQPLAQLTIDQMETKLRQGDFGKVRAVAAEQSGVIAYRKRFDDDEAGQPVDIKSAGKSITALAVFAAIDDGLLSGLDERVWPYLGSERPAPFSQITVRDLINMSSALDCNDWERRSPGQEERMYRRRNWREFALALPAREFIRDERGIGSFSYCTAGVFLLGQVVEKAVGERFDTYVQRRLFDPLDISNVHWRKSRGGEIQSGGQLTISDEALLKIGRLVLDKGIWKGERLISEQGLRTMLTPVHSLSENVHYSHLWWATALRSTRGYEGAFMMKGNGGNIVAIVPNFDAVLVVQSENYNRSEAERYSFTILTALLQSLSLPEENSRNH